MKKDPLLTVKDLRVEFALAGEPFRRRQVLRAVDNVSFSIDAGEVLGLVGESGSGKSTTARAIAQLVDVTGGSVELLGKELTLLNARELRSHRRHMQMVFQDPYSSMDPSIVVGESIAEPLEVHEHLSRKERMTRVGDLLLEVGLSQEHMERYPYEFSGGQRQRLAIARALALHPALIICDEAVSALDVSTQNQIVNLLEHLRDEHGTAYLFISHDLGVVRHISDRVAVMYLGSIVEDGPTERLYRGPAHPYTEALIAAVPIPNPRTQRRRERIVLRGDVPDPTRLPSGCRFHPRCPYAMDVCRHEVPEPTDVEGGGSVRCHLHTSGPTLGGASLLDLRRTPRKLENLQSVIGAMGGSSHGHLS